MSFEWIGPFKSATYFNGHIANMPGVKREVHKAARGVFGRAQARLGMVRATTTHTKISGPAHLTRVTLTEADGEYGDVDYQVNLEAPNPYAIEYGHGPSGAFAPDRYGEVTKAPHGLYILTGAAMLNPNFMTPSMGRKVGKR